MRKQSGFTLIEAMVVVAIIGVLAAVAIPSFQSTIVRTKVRKTTDLVSQTIIAAKSEALRRNIETYVAKVGSNICIGTTSGGCELRSDPLASGVNVSSTSLKLSPFYGVPSPAPATFTITYSGVTQSVTINMLGIVKVGVLS